MGKSSLTKFKIKLLKWIAKKIVVQDYCHEDNIIKYFILLNNAAVKEFTEDNQHSLELYLRECFDKSMHKTDWFPRNG